jgi:hypothetical protein
MKALLLSVSLQAAEGAWAHAATEQTAISKTEIAERAFKKSLRTNW